MTEREEPHLPEATPQPTSSESPLAPPDRQATFQLVPGQHIDLRLTPDGRVFVTVGPVTPGAAEQPIVAPEAAASAEGEAAAAAERQERITVRGRVSVTPRFRTTRNGQRIASFGVAEHPDAETTQYRRILAFNQRADQLRVKPLDKGQAVEVIGYPHHRQVKSNGVPKTIEEIYATAIRRR